MQPHPIQPLAKDQHGVLRFRKNQIVSDLLDLASQHGLDLNKIALADYSDEDRRQLAQLIGYSLSGYSELSSYVDDAAYAAAVAISKNQKKKPIAIDRDYYRKELKAIRSALRRPMARLFGKHPDDLKT